MRNFPSYGFRTGKESQKMATYTFKASDNDDDKKDKVKVIRLNNVPDRSLTKAEVIDTREQEIVKSEIEQIVKPRDAKKTKADDTSLFEIARAIAENNNLIVTDGNIRQFVSPLKYYKLLKGSEEDKIIRQLIPIQYKGRTNSYSTTEICRWMKSMDHLAADVDKTDEAQRFLANFRGAIYNVLSGEKVKYRDDMCFTDFIDADFPFDYQPKGKEFKKLIVRAFGDDEDSLALLQEVVGIILSNIRDLKVAVFFYGLPDTGKTLLIEVLREIVGHEFSTSVSLHQLSSEPYAVAELYGSKFNAFGEMAEVDIKRLDIFKSLASTDRITARRIYGQPFEFRNKALLLFAGNNFPRIKTLDSTSAFFNRLIIIPFFNSVPKSQQDTGLKEKLLGESDYIVKWGMEGLRRLILNGYVFTKSEASEEIKREYMSQHNSFQAFLNEACNLQNNGYMFSFEIVAAYEQFCELNRLAPISKASMHRMLKDVLKLRYHKREAKKGSKQNGYSGIELKTEYKSLME